jgi:hypothetical protein
MRRLFDKRPSPSMVVALIALFVALGGSGYAAVQINGKVIKNGTVSGKKLKRNSVTGKQVKESTLGTVRRARSATDATNAANAANATNAANAAKLGGLERSSFVRRECSPETGQIKGIVTVTASPTFSSSFVTVAGYNCSGQTIEVRRLSMGRYEVRFNGNPTDEAVITPRESGAFAHESGVFPEAAGSFQANTSTSTAFVDVSFTLIAL